MGKRCGNCANGTWLKGKDALPEVCLECKYVHAEPSKWKEKVQTNADRIRAMSDEELAEFLGGYQFADMCDEGCDNCTYHGDCDKRILEWLKQPVEGE